MSTIIPIEAYSAPKFRILWIDTWGADEATPWKSAASWATIDQPSSSNNYAGVNLLTVSPRSLPEIGEAYFYWDFGVFPGLTADAIPYGPTLVGKEVRLQLSSDDGATWKTVFWGNVDNTQELANVGGANDGADAHNGAFGGRLVYRVVDGFARTMKWKMNHHGFDPGLGISSVIAEVIGHPGYNYYVNGDVALMGNKSNRTYQRMAYITPGSRAATGPSINAHQWQGAYASSQTDDTRLWSDLEAVNHSLACVRPVHEPLFILREGTDGYSGKNPLSVDVDMPVFSFVTRVCNRSRGRGVVQLKWKDEVDGSLSIWLGITPLNATTITATSPRSGTSVSILGASSVLDYGNGHALRYRNVASIGWDLRGDSRNIDNLFYWNNQVATIYDAVETVGENIEVAATLSLADTTGISRYSKVDGTKYDIQNIYDASQQVSLAPRWSGPNTYSVPGGLSDVTKMYSFVANQYWAPRWANVYQSFGLPFQWDCRVGDARGQATALRCDYRCADDGSILIPGSGASVYKDTPQNSIEILSTLPFLSNWDYTSGLSSQAPYDSSNPNGMPSRRNAMVLGHLYNDATVDRWYFTDVPQGVSDINSYAQNMGAFDPSVHIAPDMITVIGRAADNTRMFGELFKDASNSQKMASVYDVTALAFTVALRMPHKLRFLSVNTATTSIPVITDTNSPMIGQHDTTQYRRIRTINVPGAHLWLAHPHCIWDLDISDQDADKGTLAKRAPLQAVRLTNTPAILRDDRDRVQIAHLVAVNWYLQASRSRLRVAQRYCGLLPFQRDTGTVVTDIPPALGDYVDDVYCNEDATASSRAVNTIVTQIDYNHESGETIWTSDYFDLEPGLI